MNQNIEADNIENDSNHKQTVSAAEERETMEFDVVIVGAGPSGLSAAIRIKQLAKEKNKEISVCIVEKGSEVGSHILSGAVLDTKALDELIPDWKEKDAPIKTEVKSENFWLLGKTQCINLPIPSQIKNDGNYIVSLGNVCKWLGSIAEEMGVNIFAGYPAAGVLFDNSYDRVAGIFTGEFGLDNNGNKKANYQPSINIKGKFTLFAEGCRGSLTQYIESEFNLREESSPQTYGLGLKEIWEIPPEKHELGRVIHSVGWPLMADTYGGSFLYFTENSQVSVGYVVGLDYSNPYLNPYKEFQNFKTHEKIKEILKGGKRLSYGARTINEGGFQSIPKVIFPGGALIGCSAGFVNVPKIKGSHYAMKSGMLAAESVIDAFDDKDKIMETYPTKLEESWIYKELYKVRNIRPFFKFSLIAGLINAAFVTYITRGYEPWTLKHKADNLSLRKKHKRDIIEYPEPDGELTFDLMSSVFISNTNHEEDQPCHLYLLNDDIPIDINNELFDSPETRYCPAGVYEIVEEIGEKDENGNEIIDKSLRINSQNCLHCKTCDIKDPSENIIWKTPEGGGGPNYTNM